MPKNAQPARTTLSVQEGKSVGFVGMLVVLGAVLGGYMMHGGEVGVLIQPSEFVIILGAGLGSVLISTPIKVVIQILQSLTKVLSWRHGLEGTVFRAAQRDV